MALLQEWTGSMKKIALGIAFIFLSVFFSSWAAAEVDVALRLDRVEASIVDTVRMEVSVSGSRSSDATPVIHGLEAFLVTKGGTSSRVEIINGKVNAGFTYTYFIQLRKTGTFEIGPAEIKVDGRKLKSNSVKLVVKESSEQSGSDRSPVFIEASISSPEVYVEEQTIYILKLYRRVNVDDISLSLPEIEHVVFKQLGQSSEYRATIAGATYQVLEIRYSLLASKQGEYVISPSKMKMTVRQPGKQSMVDDFFKDPFFKTPFPTFSSGRSLTLATSPLELKVIALPAEEKPTDFSGLVGKFQMESRLEPTSLKAGESATLTVQVGGKGNVNRIPDIDLPELPFARTYGDQPVLGIEQDDYGIGGTKTMKWALVPEKAGQFEIPILNVSFFNPETGKYNILHTSVHTMTVLPGTTQEIAALHSSSNTTAAERSVKQEIQQIGKDILPIHMSAGSLSISYRALTTGWLFWLVLIGPASIYLILLCGMKLRKRSPERMAQLRSRNAFKKLARQCRQDLSGCADIIDAFRDYLNDSFNLSIGTLTSDDVEKILHAKGVATDTAKKICSLIQRLENAVYARDDAKPADAANDLLVLVKTLEKEIQ